MVSVPDLSSSAVPAGRLCGQSQPRLTVDELLLRPWQATDAGSIVKAYRDPAIQKWHGRSMTPGEAVSWLSSWSERWAAETGASWAVVENDMLVGRVGLNGVSLHDGLGEAAYWVLTGRPRTRRCSASPAGRHDLDVRSGRLAPHRVAPLDQERRLVPRRGQGRVRA